MNISFSASGDRETVLKQLKAARIEIPTDAPAELKNDMLDALTDYVKDAPEGAAEFTVSGGVYVGYQLPTAKADEAPAAR